MKLWCRWTDGQRGIQSAGAAVVWSLDYDKISYLSMFASCWGLLGGSLLVALPLVFTKITDHVTIEHDLEFSDETFNEVAPQVGSRSGSYAVSEGHK